MKILSLKFHSNLQHKIQLVLTSLFPSYLFNLSLLLPFGSKEK